MKTPKLMRKTKILATLGPALEDYEKLLGVAEYANAFRFNFSHANEEMVSKFVKMIEKAREELKKDIAILGDTKGPEIRTMNKENIEFKKGDKLSLLKDITVSEENAIKSLEVGDKVLIADGKYEFIVVEKENGVVVEALGNGEITPKRKINAPGRYLEMEFMSEKDIKDIEIMKKYDFDYIAASFVSTDEEIRLLKNHINEDEIKIIAKIENEVGSRNIKSIMKESYGVMVARGDLGVEVPFEKVPTIQREIINTAREMGKISIVATHMLKSMTHSVIPTRAEVNDVSNAVMSGADAVMLSEETASGNYPIESITAMDRIIRESEIHAELDEVQDNDYKDIISSNAIKMANRLNVNIIAPTMHGTTPRKLSRHRPNKCIYVVSPRKKTAKHLSLVYGCIVREMEYEPVLERVEEIKKNLGIEKAVFVFGYPVGNHNTNSIVYI